MELTKIILSNLLNLILIKEIIKQIFKTVVFVEREAFLNEMEKLDSM